MQSVWDVMITTFQNSKEAGSYVLFYLLSLGLGMTVAWDRYGKNKMEDNWMVEEAKKQIQLWPFLYGILAVLLVVANPAAIFVLNKITPISGQYYKIWSLLLMLFLIAYGITCFLSILREKKQKALLVMGCAMLIGLAGSNYGITADRQMKEDIEEELEVLENIENQGENITLLATDKVLEYAGIYYPQFTLLYGKDLYTPDMDLGIMDTYPPELMSLYEAMKNPEECLSDIMDMASMYDCTAIVLSYFEDAPKKAGIYTQLDTTDNYIIYVK